mgnify:CR=1 FL=1
MAKKGTTQRKYSSDFKISVIMDMRETRLGYRETARKYDLVRQSEASAASMLHRCSLDGCTRTRCGRITYTFPENYKSNQGILRSDR